MTDLSHDRLLKISSVAKLVDTSVATVRRWINGRNGERLKTICLPGGRKRVALSDLQAFLERHNTTLTRTTQDMEGLRRHRL